VVGDVRRDMEGHHYAGNNIYYLLWNMYQLCTGCPEMFQPKSIETAKESQVCWPPYPFWLPEKIPLALLLQILSNTNK
jgi:hypothetical protein